MCVARSQNHFKKDKMGFDDLFVREMEVERLMDEAIIITTPIDWQMLILDCFILGFVMS